MARRYSKNLKPYTRVIAVIDLAIQVLDEPRRGPNVDELKVPFSTILDRLGCHDPMNRSEN